MISRSLFSKLILFAKIVIFSQLVFYGGYLDCPPYYAGVQ